MDFAQFQECLVRTLDKNSQPREQAEAALKKLLETNPDALATMLMQALSAGQTSEIKITAAILLRRYYYYLPEPDMSLCSKCSPQTQELVKQELLVALINENVSAVRKNIRDTVNVIASHIQMEWMDKPQGRAHFWPELLQTLWAAAQHESAELREVALLILSEVPQAFQDHVEKYLQSISQLLEASLNGTDHLSCQVAACKAMTGFLSYGLHKKEQRAYLARLIPLEYQVILAALQKGDETRAQEVLESLIEVAEYRPKLYRNYMPETIEHLTNIAQATELQDGTRRMAVEVLLELCISAEGMVRKFPDVTAKLVPLFLKMTMEYEDDPTWSKQVSDDAGDDEDSNCTFGEQSLDRLSLAMGGETVVPVIFQYLPSMLDDQNSWQSRAAALTAIAAIAEGCREKMQLSLTDVMDKVTPRLLDPHPRVRYTACNAVGQLSMDFAAPRGKERRMGFQTMFHSTVIPALLQMMQDDENPRVQAHGASALVNFCEHAHKDTLQPHLVNILMRLAEMLRSSHRNVLEQTVTALATVADTSKELFTEYYVHFMPSLKQILFTPPRDKAWRLLRGKTMECITLIGIAVKKEIFRNDATEIMEALAQTQQDAETDPDDPQISYMLAAWARICEILGDDFVPYLGTVMPPLIRSIQLEPEVQILDAGTNTESLSGGAANWEIYPAGEDRQIGIKTSILEEKKTACEMLRIYVEQMKGAFAPYIQTVAPIVLELLVFVFDEDVRSVAASTIPLLLRSAFLAGGETESPSPEVLQVVNELWQVFSTNLISAIKLETELEVIQWQVAAIKDSIEILGAEFISQPILEEIVTFVDTYMQDYTKRCEERKERRCEDEDYDAQAEKNIKLEEEDEIQVILEVSNLVHILFGLMGAPFLVPFQGLMPEFTKMLDPNGRPASDHELGLVVLDDVIEYGGQDSFALMAPFVDFYLHYLSDTQHPAVLQAAAYGVGVMAKCGGSQYHEVCTRALPALQQVVEDPEARKLGRIDATENALSAMVKICRIPELGIPLAETVPKFLSWLPMTNDEEEAEYVYAFLCELLQKQDPSIFNEQNLVKTMQIFAKVIGSFVAPVEPECVGTTIVETIKGLEAKNPGFVNQILPQIADADRENLLKYLQ